jgi:Zn-dependent protease with chaperone function
VQVHGRYFFPHSARGTSARALIGDDRSLRIEAPDGTVLASIPAKSVRVSSRLGNIARRFEFPDGGRFETEDNDGADTLLRDLRHIGASGLLNRFEGSLRWIAVATALAIAAGYAFVEFGIPAIALWLAQETPRSVAVLASNQTLDTLDGGAIGQSTLSEADKAKAFKLFETVAAKEPRGTGGYKLLFRHGDAIGANAFALPDGRIVMTDELWGFVKHDDEIEGVFAHEMAHVNHAHGLQRVYQASLVPAAFAVVTGDLSQVSQISAVLPGLLVQSAYSREFEQQADDDAAALLKRIGGKPSRLAEFLERLDQHYCGKDGCPPNWLGSHPETSLRAQRLRKAEREP